MVRREKKRTREGERQLGGKVECSTLRHFPGLIICIIAAFRFLDGTLEQKDICARPTFKEYPNLYRENGARNARNVGGGISQRYERESSRTRYTNMETKEKKMEILHYKEYHVAIDSTLRR